LIDPRLCYYKEEEDGSTVVDGVQYVKLIPLLLNLIKRQDARIKALEAHI